MKTAARIAPAIALLAMLAGCQDTAAPSDVHEVAAAANEAADDVFDWARCRIPGLSGPVPGRLFVVDGGDPVPGAEPGREAIRRVDIHVPGPVTLLLTAPDSTVWMLRPSPHTQMHAIIASGEQSQRITGQKLGNRRAEHSAVMGHPCGRYWLEGSGEAGLAEVTTQLFGRPPDAVFRLRVGQVDIGVPERLPQPRVREPDPVLALEPATVEPATVEPEQDSNDDDPPDEGRSDQ